MNSTAVAHARADIAALAASLTSGGVTVAWTAATASAHCVGAGGRAVSTACRPHTATRRRAAIEGNETWRAAPALPLFLRKIGAIFGINYSEFVPLRSSSQLLDQYSK
eukprot:6173511-Pleurochrysis_carterae.AAC.4